MFDAFNNFLSYKLLYSKLDSFFTASTDSDNSADNSSDEINNTNEDDLQIQMAINNSLIDASQLATANKNTPYDSEEEQLNLQ